MSRIGALFLCTGNSARSQTAEAYLRGLDGYRFEAFSAGLEPRGIRPPTRRITCRIGLDLAGHTGKGVKEYLRRRASHHVGTVFYDVRDAAHALFGALAATLTPTAS